MIHQITFSPTGGTKKVASALVAGISSTVEAHELCNPEQNLSPITLGKDDLAVIAMPVYGGRIPALAISRLRSLVKAGGARCVVVATYGNRAYDDALLEMYKTCTAMGFSMLAAVGAVAEHSIVRKYGAGRPDAEDLTELKAFGEQIISAMAAGAVLDERRVSGNFPYKKAGAGPHPTADKSCVACGRCAQQCPVGAIDSANPRKVNKDLCVSCMRCVSVCPNGFRSIGTIMQGMVALAIKKGCAERKKNELFV